MLVVDFKANDLLNTCNFVRRKDSKLLLAVQLIGKPACFGQHVQISVNVVHAERVDVQIRADYAMRGCGRPCCSRLPQEQAHVTVAVTITHRRSRAAICWNSADSAVHLNV